MCGGKERWKVQKISLIAVDLDGTLLNDRRELTPRSLAALDRAATEGVEIVVASGRTWSNIPQPLLDRAYIRYYILLNGAQLLDAVSGENLRVAALTRPETEMVLDELEQKGLLYSCVVDGEYCMDRVLYDRIDEYVPAESPFRHILKKARRPVSRLRETLREEQKPIFHIVAEYCEPELRAALLRDLRECFSELNVTSSTPSNVEIDAGDADKGAALQFLLDYIGMTCEETMTFGDSLNDISMLKFAGTGVAMGNAVPEVRAAADYAAMTNSVDGVAREIEKIIQKKEKDV
ncbi:MAG: Cof-type HAD-IIB family hydrolase [Lachnospiraceae bacterium]|nr:Cof-type HAD-IIB family hydrolase [Lachnospiraceae bacterium]